MNNSADWLVPEYFYISRRTAEISIPCPRCQQHDASDVQTRLDQTRRGPSLVAPSLAVRFWYILAVDVGTVSPVALLPGFPVAADVLEGLLAFLLAEPSRLPSLLLQRWRLPQKEGNVFWFSFHEVWSWETQMTNGLREGGRERATDGTRGVIILLQCSNKQKKWGGTLLLRKRTRRCFCSNRNFSRFAASYSPFSKCRWSGRNLESVGGKTSCTM